MLLRVAGLTSSIPGDNPRRQPPTKNTPRDKPSAPETTPPTKNTPPGDNPAPTWGSDRYPNRPMGSGIIWKLALTCIPDTNQPTTLGPDPNPNQPTGGYYQKTDTNPY